MLASNILKIKHPGDLFPSNVSDAKKKYHELARTWHPDTNNDPDAVDVFKHITTLYQEAIDQIKDGVFESKNSLTVVDQQNRKHYFGFHSKHEFELGYFVVGDNHVTYFLDEHHKSLYENALTRITSFKYASPRMEKEASRYLPGKYRSFKTNDGKYVLMIKKTPDLVLLQDVLRFYDNKIDSRHVAWILNTIYNLCCYFNYSGIVHNDISPMSYFISPQYHSGALLGGWWYTKKEGHPIKFLPRRTYNYLPWEVRSNKMALQKIDLELVKATGRELLGDIRGKVFPSETPEPMKAWLNQISSEAVTDYRNWGEVLKKSFGQRRFVHMKVTPETLYK